MLLNVIVLALVLNPALPSLPWQSKFDGVVLTLVDSTSISHINAKVFYDICTVVIGLLVYFPMPKDQYYSCVVMYIGIATYLSTVILVVNYFTSHVN